VIYQYNNAANALQIIYKEACLRNIHTGSTLFKVLLILINAKNNKISFPFNNVQHKPDCLLIFIAFQVTHFCAVLLSSEHNEIFR